MKFTIQLLTLCFDLDTCSQLVDINKHIECSAQTCEQSVQISVQYVLYTIVQTCKYSEKRPEYSLTVPLD